jgi:hypothetical protein
MIGSYDISVPAFAYHVVVVVGDGAKKQMVGIHAVTHVAPMKHAQLRQRSAMKPPGVTMSTETLALNRDGAVSPTVSAADPQPACPGFPNLRPKQLDSRF